jgi:hypothetical protein
MLMAGLRSKRAFVLFTVLVVLRSEGGDRDSRPTSQTVINDDTGKVNLRIVRTAADGFDSGWHVHPGRRDRPGAGGLVPDHAAELHPDDRERGADVHRGSAPSRSRRRDRNPCP